MTSSNTSRCTCGQSTCPSVDVITWPTGPTTSLSRYACGHFTLIHFLLRPHSYKCLPTWYSHNCLPTPLVFNPSHPSQWSSACTLLHFHLVCRMWSTATCVRCSTPWTTTSSAQWQKSWSVHPAKLVSIGGISSLEGSYSVSVSSWKYVLKWFACRDNTHSCLTVWTIDVMSLCYKVEMMSSVFHLIACDYRLYCHADPQ